MASSLLMAWNRKTAINFYSSSLVVVLQQPLPSAQLGTSCAFIKWMIKLTTSAVKTVCKYISLVASKPGGKFSPTGASGLNTGNYIDHANLSLLHSTSVPVNFKDLVWTYFRFLPPCKSHEFWAMMLLRHAKLDLAEHACESYIYMF